VDVPSTAVGWSEREWQLDADDLRAVSRRLRGAPLAAGFTVGTATSMQLVDTYYETDDWRFHRAGYALRLRRTRDGIEATLKAFGQDTGGYRQRHEVSETLPAGGAAALLAARGAVGTRVRAVVGRRSLRALFEIRTRRRAFPLRHGGHIVAEIALDTTSLVPPAGTAPVRLLARVEVEVDRSATPFEVEPFVTALRDACGLEPARVSKYAAALEARGLSPEPHPDLGPTAVDDEMAIGAVAFAALRAGFANLFAHEPGARLGEDIEALHQMRVATRKLRAAIKLFDDALPRRARALRRTLGWLGDVLGGVRDLDVEIADLATWRAGLAPRDGAALDAAVAVLRRRREAARERMLRTLDSRRYERFVAAAVAMARGGPGSTPGARVPALQAAPDLIATGYRKLRKLGDALSDASEAREHHRLRIRAKRLRYALEFLRDVYAKPMRPLLDALVDLQQVLGRFHDADVAAGHLHELCETYGRRLPPRTLFVIGALAERQARRAAKLRRRSLKLYRRLRGGAWKRLRDAMRKRRPPRPVPVPVRAVRRRRGPRRADRRALGARPAPARA
jgi:CHAD domain-containing protein